MTKKEKQDGSINGWLLAWVIATTLIVVNNLIFAYNDLYSWIITILLATSLIMVFYGKGTRWLMVVTGLVLGLIFLYLAISVIQYGSSAFGAGLRGGLVVNSAEELSLIVQSTIVGSIVYAAYMLASGFYFMFSKRVKARFGK